MKIFPTLLIAAGLTTGLAGAASAQTMNINARQERLEDRIAAGERTGQLSRMEADRLRRDLRDTAALETRYRGNGLSGSERRILNDRFDRISSQVRDERRDDDRRGHDRPGDWIGDITGWFGGRGWTDQRGAWVPVNRRQAQLERRIEQGVARGQLTRREAWQARREYDQIARIEAGYRRGGLSNWERADLDRRFDALSRQIRQDRRDDNRRYGMGYGERR